MGAKNVSKKDKSKIKIDPKWEAERILMDHNKAYMESVIEECENADGLVETLYRECAFILTRRTVEGDFTLWEMEAIRNALAKLIWDLVTRDGLDKEMTDNA